MISIWADGSSSGRSDGAGGYGWVIVSKDTILDWGYGGSSRTTNNLMELEGCIQGLEAAKRLQLKDSLELVSDSQYALGMASGAWNPSTNFAEVERLVQLTKETKARTRWVPGHDGVEFNEICDQLAKRGRIESMTPAQLAAYQKKKAKKR